MFYDTDLAAEQGYLETVADAINVQISNLHSHSEQQEEDMRSSSKYLWENITDVTQSEKNFWENELNLGSHRKTQDTQSLHNLEAMRKSAWFGRIDFSSDTDASLYIGLGTVRDADGNVLVYDWRAPISSLYYDYDTGKASYTCPEGEIEGEIVRKRQYEIQNRVIHKISDVEQQLPDDMLMSLLEKNASRKIKNIVHTIAREQNQLIRNRTHRILMIQGPAGSGKTSVALYRAAYLLYSDRNRLSADNMLILSPNDIFINYISDVLPQIGETNVTQTTFRDFILSVISGFRHIDDVTDMCEILYSPGNETRKLAYKYKNTEDFYAILRQYAKYAEKKIGNCFIPIPGILNKKEFDAMYYDKYKDIPVRPRIRLIRDITVERMTGIVSKESLHKFKKEYNGYFRRIDSRKLYADLHADEDLFWMMGEGDTPDELSDICRLVAESFKSKRLFYEDVIPLLFFKSLIDGLPEQKNIRHLLIDEAQDYNTHQLSILRTIFPKASLTVLGDVNQALLPDSDFSYEKVAEIFGSSNEDTVLKTLNKTFRSTKQINLFALALLGETNVEAVDRKGARPVLLHGKDMPSVFASMNRHIARHTDGNATVAVICKNEKQCRQISKHVNARLLTHASYEINPGEAVLVPAYLAKGLEFDYVIVYDGSSMNYTKEDRKLLYTICTRALHKLRIYYCGEVSPLIAAIDEQLYEKGEIS